MIEGAFQKNQRALIIEDVITTGSSIIETAEGLEAEGVVIYDVVALICREKMGIKNLSKRYNPHTVLNLTTVLDTLAASSLLSQKEKNLIEKFKEENA